MSAAPNKTEASSTVRIRTLVLKGGRVEVTSPELREGQAVEVDIRPATPLPAALDEGRHSALEAIESLGGHRLFSSASEVDAHVNQERDSWR